MEVKKVLKTNWKTKNMPEKNRTFTLNKHFTKVEYEALKFGHIPEAMEDKWFWYEENGKLYLHRSWTGSCIYIIDLDEENHNHKVIVNCNKDEYKCEDDETEISRLSSLLDWFCRENYDYYHEWLSETADMLKKDKITCANTKKD